MSGYKRGANASDINKIKALQGTHSAEEISAALLIALPVVQGHMKGSSGEKKRKRVRARKFEKENNKSEI